MKKFLISTGSLLQRVQILFIAMLAVMAVSCNKSSNDSEDDSEETATETAKINEKTVQNLLDKYENGQFTEKDYSAALDIVEEFVKEYKTQLMQLAKKCDSSSEFSDGINNLVNKNASVLELSEVLEHSNEYEMGQKNYSRYKKLDNKIEQAEQEAYDYFDAK